MRNLATTAHLRLGAGTLAVVVAATFLAIPTLCSAQLLATNFEAHEVVRYDLATGQVVAVVPAGVGGLSFPQAVTIGPDGSVYVGSADHNQVFQYTLRSGAFLSKFLRTPSGERGEHGGVVFGTDGNLYRNDGSRIHKYDGRTGAYLGVFAEDGGAMYGMAFGPDGNLYVAQDAGVQRYDGQTGARIDVFVSADGSRLDSPWRLTFGPDGNLYVTDRNRHQVLSYDGRTGAPLRMFGGGALSSPAALAFGPDGHLYVSSLNTRQILRYDGPSGFFLGVFANFVQAYDLMFASASCAVTTADSYLNGHALNAALRLAGIAPPLPVNARLWLDAPNIGTIQLANIGADGSFVLPSQYDATAPFILGAVTPAWPRGEYRMGCRLLNPTTGSVIAENVRTFVIQ